MTVIQQQRLIGATLVVLLVAVLAWLVLASVDTQDSSISAQRDEPIVFEPVVEPIGEEMIVTEGAGSTNESSADDFSALSPQPETKVVIPAQDIDTQPSTNEAPTSTNTTSAPSDQEAPDTSAKDELTSLAEELDAPESDTPSETEIEPQTETTTEPEPQQQTADIKQTEAEVTSPNNAGDDRTQWVIQLGSFSKPENAQSLQRELEASGYEAVIEEATIDGRSIYRVRLPADDNRTRLEETSEALAESLGLEPQILTISP